MLKLGTRGSDVSRLQQQLSQAGFTPGAPGVFDANTKAAVLQFQRAQGLKSDGIVGPKTAQKLWGSADESYFDGRSDFQPVSSGGGAATPAMRRLADNARDVALSMSGYRGGGRCAKGVSRAIQRTLGVKVWGNGNQIDNNLPRGKFQQVNMSLEEALKTPGLVLTWERTSTRLGRTYGHTAVTLGDGRSSASDFVERNTLAAEAGRRGLKIFRPL